MRGRRVVQICYLPHLFGGVVEGEARFGDYVHVLVPPNHINRLFDSHCSMRRDAVRQFCQFRHLPILCVKSEDLSGL